MGPGASELAARVGWLSCMVLLACGGEPLAEVPEVGSVEGVICTPQARLAQGATVSAPGRRGEVQATTDAAGYFVLNGVLAGERTLEVSGAGVSQEIEVTVPARGLVTLPAPTCLSSGLGAISGKICGVGEGVAADTYWLSGAQVSVTLGSTTLETTSDLHGDFLLEGVPAGTRQVKVVKGSYAAVFSVNVVAGETVVAQPVCVGEGARLGVVTGIYDPMEEQLVDLGLEISGCVPSDAPGCPDELASDGGILLVDGGSNAYITGLLLEPDVLAELDILFFDCGLQADYLASSPPAARQALRDFVSGGGSIYVSDWGYEILRWAFPDLLDFVGNDDVSGAAKVGALDLSLDALVVDAGLAQALGGDADVELVYNKGSWVVLEPEQPEGVRTWVLGDVGVAGGGVIEDAPLLVSLPYGDGRIFFTTFHSGEQTSEQMPMVQLLRRIVFEL